MNRTPIYSFSIENLVQKKQEFDARAAREAGVLAKSHKVVDMLETSSDSSSPTSKTTPTPKTKENQGATLPSAKKKSTVKSSLIPLESSGIDSTATSAHHDEIGPTMFDLYYKGQKSGDLKELLDHLGPTK